MSTNNNIETQNEKDANIEMENETFLDEKDLKIQALEAEIEKLQTEIHSIKKGAADIMNRNKQMEIDLKYAASGLVKNLLTPLSYFEGALKIQTDNDQMANFLKGFEMIYNLIIEQLMNSGLKEIKTAINDIYDPRIHEVFEVVETDDEENKIVAVVQTGYYFKDRVIQPVKVKVTVKKQMDNENNQEENTGGNE